MLVKVHPNVRRLRPLKSRRWSFVTWSVADQRTGLVTAHVPSLVLRRASLVVHAGGRARAIRTGVKNVHAWVMGSYPTTDTIPEGVTLVPVTYRPAADKPAAFWFSETGEAIEPSQTFEVVVLSADGKMCVGVRKDVERG